MARLLVFLVASIWMLASFAGVESWSDKTICRLVSTHPDNIQYKAEVENRDLSCSAQLGPKVSVETTTCPTVNYPAGRNHVFDQVIPTVVSLGSSQRALGGSGVLIGPQHVLTCRHGNIDIDPLYVRNVHNEVVRGRLIDSTEYFPDAALVELDRPFKFYQTAPIASRSPDSGDNIFSVGHPRYLHAEGYGWGITTGLKEDFSTYRDPFGEDYGHLDSHTKYTRQLFSLAIGKGNSGGPIFNDKGEVISIVAGSSQGSHIKSNHCGVFDHRYNSRHFYDQTPEVWTREFNGVEESFITGGPKLSYLEELISRNDVTLGGSNPGRPANCTEQIIYKDQQLVEVFKPLIKDIDPKVVWTGTSQINDDFSSADGMRFSPGGSGMMISPKLFITVAHGLGDFDTVVLNSGQGFAGTTLIADDKTDLALGIIDGQVTDYHNQILATNLKPGAALAVTGNPAVAAYHLGGWLTSAGRVKSFGLVGSLKDPRYRTSVPVRPGNSGSAAYDVKGRIVGVVSGGDDGAPNQLKIIDYDPTLDGGTHPPSMPFKLRSSVFASTTSIVKFLERASNNSVSKPFVKPLLDLVFDEQPARLNIRKISSKTAEVRYSVSTGISTANVLVTVGDGGFFRRVIVAGKALDIGIKPNQPLGTVYPDYTPPLLLNCDTRGIKGYCLRVIPDGIDEAIVVEQYSGTDCVRGRTWDIDDKGLWTKGCRAKIKVNGMATICEAFGGYKHYCVYTTDLDLKDEISFAQQESRSSCKRGKSWGVDNKGVWVSQGCRAKFKLNGVPDPLYVKVRTVFDRTKDDLECKDPEAYAAQLELQRIEAQRVKQRQKEAEKELLGVAKSKTAETGDNLVSSRDLTPSGRLLGTYDDFRHGPNTYCREAGYKGSTGQIEDVDYACIQVANTADIAARNNGNWKTYASITNASGQGWCEGPNTAVAWVVCK